MKLKFTILSIFVGINFCYAQNDIIYSQNKEALEKEYLQIESQLKPGYHLNESDWKKNINCDLMISTFLLASKALEVEKDYLQLICDEKYCDYKTNHDHFGEMFQKIQDAKRLPNFEAFRSWFKSPFSNNKERKKSDLFETFNIIVDKLSISQEKKVELKNYSSKLQVEFKKEYGSDKIVPYYKYLLINELKYLPINMGDFCAIIESQHVSLGFLDEQWKETEKSYYEKAKVNYFEDKGFLTKMILKSINVLYDHNCLPKIDKHTEGQLFLAKYLYNQSSIKNPIYLDRIKNIPYNELTSFLFSKNRDVLFNIRLLNLLRESGMKEINLGDDNNAMNTDIVFALKSIVRKSLEEKDNKKIYLTVKSNNSCFISKINGSNGYNQYDDEKTTETDFFKVLYPNFFDLDYNQFENERISIINTGDDFKTEKSKILKKNQPKRYSELSDDEKLKLSDYELSQLIQTEVYEKSNKEEKIKGFEKFNEALSFIFRDDTAIMSKTLTDYYKYYLSLNNILFVNELNSFSKYFDDKNSTSGESSLNEND